MNMDLFPCYSVPLVKFLESQGIRYKLVGLHPETKRKFWVFIRTIKLNECLNRWNETNPNICKFIFERTINL